jgi:hypothetical protein
VDESIYPVIEMSQQEKCCLFSGNLAPQLRAVAPHLIRIGIDDPVTKFLFDNGWGHSWGVFLSSSVSMEALRRHFRTFLRVRDAAGRYLLFRYYDPRVLRAYLPTCTPDELTTIFGPVDRFAVEAEDGKRLTEYRLMGAELSTTDFDLY